MHWCARSSDVCYESPDVQCERFPFCVCRKRFNNCSRFDPPRDAPRTISYATRISVALADLRGIHTFVYGTRLEATEGSLSGRHVRSCSHLGCWNGRMRGRRISSTGTPKRNTCGDIHDYSDCDFWVCGKNRNPHSHCKLKVMFRLNRTPYMEKKIMAGTQNSGLPFIFRPELN